MGSPPELRVGLAFILLFNGFGEAYTQVIPVNITFGKHIGFALMLKALL